MNKNKETQVLDFMKIAAIVGCIIFFISFSAQAKSQEKYRGGIQVRLVEPNGDLYGSTTTEELVAGKNYLGLEQLAGQNISISKSNVQFDASRDRKYHIIIHLETIDNDQFEAKVQLFNNSTLTQSNATTQIISKHLIEHSVAGILNRKSEHRFVEDGLPNLYLTFNFDKQFTTEEIKARLREKALSQK